MEKTLKDFLDIKIASNDKCPKSKYQMPKSFDPSLSNNKKVIRVRGLQGDMMVRWCGDMYLLQDGSLT